jgi:tRNA (cmo5U34)-methyltransferase
MIDPNRPKSTVEEIRRRFDNEVDRFSSLETGQAATMDAPLVMQMICTAAAGTTPKAKRLLDVGCGAGNYSLKLLQSLPRLNVTLLDLSGAMLDRATERVSAATDGGVRAIQSDIREIDLGMESFDIILASAVLHHLRDDSEWENVFRKFHQCLTPGGSLWISDLVDHGLPAVSALMVGRYGKFLEDLRGAEYRQTVFDYVLREDTPKPLMFQIDLLRKVGFRSVEILHKNSVFAAFGALK